MTTIESQKDIVRPFENKDREALPVPLDENPGRLPNPKLALLLGFSEIGDACTPANAGGDAVLTAIRHQLQIHPTQ